MPDDLSMMLDALAEDAQAAARLGTGADIRRRARRQNRRVLLSVGTLTAAAAALVTVAVSTLAGGAHGAATNHSPATNPTGSPVSTSSPTPGQTATTPQSVAPDPSVYHSEAWLPTADAPMASRYQWTFAPPGVDGGTVSATGLGVTPVCGSHYVDSNSIDGSAQVGTFLPSAGNGGWSNVNEMLYFLPSAYDAASTYSRLLPDLNKCLGGASGFSGTNLSAGFTAHTTNGFGWYQRYRFQADGATPRMAADYILVARQGSVIAVYSAIAAWAPGQQGPAYDTSGDQQSLDSLAAHLAAYTDPTSLTPTTSSATGTLHGTAMLEGGPYQSGLHPDSGSVSILRGTAVFADVPLKDGAFTATLPVGTYTVTDPGMPGCNSVTVTIAQGHDATAQIVCALP